MNPITETRYGLVRYVVLWMVFAAVYATAFGLAAALPAGAAALGGAVFGVVSGFEGLILWNVLKYGKVTAAETPAAVSTPTADYFRIWRFLQLTVVGILFVAVAVGAECLAIYLTVGIPTTELFQTEMFASFARTIPARSLLVAAVYVCFALWYSSAARSNEGGNGNGGFSYAEKEATKTPATAATDTVEPLERITVRGAGGRIEVIGVDEIVFLQAEGDYVAIVTSGGRWLKEGTMKAFEEALPRDWFVRVHRSYIVAVGHISRIETSGRDHTLILRTGDGRAHGGTSIRISDTGYRLLKRTLGL